MVKTEFVTRFERSSGYNLQYLFYIIIHMNQEAGDGIEGIDPGGCLLPAQSFQVFPEAYRRPVSSKINLPELFCDLLCEMHGISVSLKPQDLTSCDGTNLQKFFGSRRYRLGITLNGFSRRLCRIIRIFGCVQLLSNNYFSFPIPEQVY